MSYAERRESKLTGWWYADVEYAQPHGTTMRYRRRFKTKGEADGYEAYVKATGIEPAGMTDTPVGSFKDIAAQFKARNPDWGRRDRSCLQRLDWWIDQLGDMDIKAITTPLLDKYVDKLLKLPGRDGARLSNRTVNRYLDCPANVLDYAVSRGLIQGKPIVPRLENKGHDRKVVASFDLEDAICRWIEANRDPRIAFMVHLFAETGCRRSELWKVRAEQIDAENGSITLWEDQTKTDAARAVPVPLDMARQYKAMVANGAVPNIWRTYRVFKEAAKACGAPKELTLHSLRHTRATRLLDAGVDIRVVAEMLGHSTIQTTMKYTHPDFAKLAEAAKKVHQARGEVAEKGVVVPMPLRKTA